MILTKNEIEDFFIDYIKRNLDNMPIRKSYNNLGWYKIPDHVHTN